MTENEAIKSLLSTCADLKESIERLQEENAFLTDTIEKNNLGKAVSERRSLLAENRQSKTEAELAQQMKKDYESKVSEVDMKLADINKKQADMDSYIDHEAACKIQGIRETYEGKKVADTAALAREREDQDAFLAEQERSYKNKNRKCIIVAVVGVALGIAGILVGLLV